MTTKQIRITTVAEEIVKEYAGQDSLSRGIIRMREVLQEKDREIVRLKGIANNLQKKEVTTSKPYDDTFWQQMGECVTKIFEKYSADVTKSLRATSGMSTTSTPTFTQASKLVVTPVKTYGKIDESEKLEEPVGRQGREVK